MSILGITNMSLAYYTYCTPFVCNTLLENFIFFQNDLSTTQFEFKHTEEYVQIPQTKALLPTCNIPKIMAKNFSLN